MTHILGRRYRLLSQLAVGGMGEVWSAHDELLNRRVAVKVLRRELLADATARERFRNEARIAAMLVHANIARIYDFSEDDPAYLVMELVHGEALAAILQRAGTLAPEATLDLLAQAARALQHAHDAGVVHRDLKPGNLLIGADGTLKVTDFGIAQTKSSNRLTQTGTIMGTVQYIAPEQADGHPAGPLSDIYSLGIVAYECLTGNPPFDAETPVAVAVMHLKDEPHPLPGDLPESLRALIVQMLSKDPLERPSTARDIADRAAMLRESLIDLRGAEDVLGPPPPPKEGRPVVRVAALVAGVLLAGALLGGSLMHGRIDATLSGKSEKSPSTRTETPVTPVTHKK